MSLSIDFNNFANFQKAIAKNYLVLDFANIFTVRILIFSFIYLQNALIFFNRFMFFNSL